VLVLTRRSEESVIIGGNIIVTILDVEGEKVKLGIDAPREVTILRKELLAAVHQQNRLAKQLANEPEPSTFQGLRNMLDREAEEGEPAA
jgi:carbon storage regulator